MGNNDKQAGTNHHYTADDEIDLFELLGTIYNGKYIIIAVTLICLLLAGGAAWWMTPVYSSRVHFLPPLEIDIQEINKFARVETKSKSFKVDELFQVFLENLTSGELRETIFEKYHLEDYYGSNVSELPPQQKAIAFQRALSRFRSDLSLTLPGRNATTQERSLELSMKKSPEDVAIILFDIYESAQRKTIYDIYTAIDNDRTALIDQNLDRIAGLRNGAAKHREDRIAQLDEAIVIARALNLAEPRQVGPDTNIDGVTNQGLPLYSLGYRYLEAERDVLLKRKSNDPFIPELRNLQVWVETLEAITIDVDKFQVARLSQPPLPATEPDKPKPALMLAVASVAGLMLGTVLVLVRQAVITRRKTLATDLKN